MACTQPHSAVRRSDGVLLFGRSVGFGSDVVLSLPCGKCLGCLFSRSREWVLRCNLEASQHLDLAWCTLTYRPEDCPPTLSKFHVALYLKRLRARMQYDDRLRGIKREKRRRVRFLASGEYGEKRGRPHYHAILFGVSPADPAVTAAWPFGFVEADNVTPERIAYCAGYVQKKVGQELETDDLVQLEDGTWCDPGSGEVVEYQPPFRVMSRRPGLGGWARKYHHQWRDRAYLDGLPVPVPRFLHESWKAHASEEQLQALAAEKAARPRPERARLEAQAVINQARQQRSAERRGVL